MTITEFLNARLDEDEAAARENVEYEDNVWETDGWLPPARVLAEVEAKRRIVARETAGRIMRGPVPWFSESYVGGYGGVELMDEHGGLIAYGAEAQTMIEAHSRADHRHPCAPPARPALRRPPGL